MVASENIGSMLVVSLPSGNDFAGSVYARRYLTKLISDILLRQRSTAKQRALVITKHIFDCYNGHFLLETVTGTLQKSIR